MTIRSSLAYQLAQVKDREDLVLGLLFVILGSSVPLAVLVFGIAEIVKQAVGG